MKFFSRRSFCHPSLFQSIFFGSLILFLSSCSQNNESTKTTATIDAEVDFVLRMEEGKYRASNEKFAYHTEGKINDDIRWGIFEHAPCRIEFPDVYIAPNAKLEFSIGVNSNAWRNPGDGVCFQITAQLPTLETRILFRKYIDPKSTPEHRRWLPQQIAVEDVQNVTATLIFETFPGENANTTNNHSDYAFWANPRLVSSGRKVEHRINQQPNVLLITLDTTRPDYLGCYGNDWIQTPFLDRVANEGVLFEQAYTACYHTNPSHVSILTSLSAFAHGVIGNEHMLTTPFPCLPQILKELNYTNLAVISAYHLNNFMEGLGKWFDVYDKPKPMKVLPGSTISSIAIQRLEQVHNRPFFYWVHYYDPHQPYRALGDCHRMYYKGDPTAPNHHSMENALFPKDWDVDSPDSWVRPYRDLEYFRKEYGAEVTYMDAQLGRLFDAMKRLRLDRNTIVIIVADHGESMGEHGVYFDHWTPFDTDLHVPLLISYPPKIPQGKRITTPVSTLDIAPTVLSLLDESDNFLAKKLFEGRSLQPLWSADAKEERRIESMNGPYFINSVAWDERYKLIWELQRMVYHQKNQTFSNRVWIYDRQDDPGEQNPAACFYWGDNNNRQDNWEREKQYQSIALQAEGIDNTKEKALAKKIPSAEELRRWFAEKNRRDVVRSEYVDDPDFYQRVVSLLERARQNVNPKTVWDRMQDVPDVLSVMGQEPSYLQPVDPAMQDFLQSLGYVGN